MNNLDYKKSQLYTKINSLSNFTRNLLWKTLHFIFIEQIHSL